MKQPVENEKSNKNILRITYVVVCLFLLMIGYEGYFLTFQREDVINNPYNARLNSLSDRIVRGQIKSSDGVVLAETVTGGNKIESRNYPYGSLYAHVVGYSSRGKTGLDSYKSHRTGGKRIFREEKSRRRCVYDFGSSDSTNGF